MTTIPDFTGCPWPIDPGCLGTDWDTYDPTVQDRSVAFASATLRRLTGYQVGGCPVTVRPCKQGCAGAFLPHYEWSYQHAYMPGINVAGYWINSCGCTTDCSCTTLCEVVLPEPVGEVMEVKSDGVVVDQSDYRLDRNRLVWTGVGDCPWPTCQDLSASDSNPGTFSITYLNSYPVDGLGAYAAGVLANEFARACAGNKCRLPPSVSSVSRAGVTYEVVAGSFPGGITGIREVDAFIALWNPNALQRPATVWSPDIRNPRVVT
jgi:hypothetical protein